MSQAGFLLKVLALSVGLSLVIKYSGPVPIPATPIAVLALVFIPTVVVAIALWWRSLPRQTN